MIEYLRNAADFKKSIAYIEIALWPAVLINREAFDRTNNKID